MDFDLFLDYLTTLFQMRRRFLQGRMI